jgi:hypothetical protein
MGSTTPELKRKAEDEASAQRDGEAATKKARVEGDVGQGQPASQPPRPKPVIDLSVLEKAKRALQLQKELKEKMKALQQGKRSEEATVTAAPPALRPAAKGLPPPLLVDDQGREIDPATGLPKGAAEAAAAAAEAAATAEAAARARTDFYDPGIGNRALKRQDRRPRAELRFVEEGRFQKEAETARLRAKFGRDYVRQLEERKKKEAELMADGQDANLIPLGVRVRNSFVHHIKGRASMSGVGCTGVACLRSYFKLVLYSTYTLNSSP